MKNEDARVERERERVSKESSSSRGMKRKEY
jgi:hypothetical protein